MSISSTVATLARALASRVEDPALAAHVATLAEMPRYVADARLDLWEEALMQQDRRRVAPVAINSSTNA